MSEERSKDRFEARMDERDRHIHALHEELMNRIRAIPTDGPTRAEMQQGFREQRELIEKGPRR